MRGPGLDPAVTMLGKGWWLGLCAQQGGAHHFGMHFFLTQMKVDRWWWCNVLTSLLPTGLPPSQFLKLLGVSGIS